MSHFQTRVKNFFAIRENFFSRRPFGRGQLVGANGFMRLFDPTVKHFSAKNFTDLLHADCLFNQHTEKTQEILDKFLCLFLFALLLFLPIEALSSPLRPESAPILFRTTGFLQTLKTVPQPWIFCCPLFGSDTKQKGSPKAPLSCFIYGNA